MTNRLLFDEALRLGTDSVDELMSDEIAPHISNSDQLLEKMFSYQEILTNVILILDNKIQELQKHQKSLSRSKTEKII